MQKQFNLNSLINAIVDAVDAGREALYKYNAAIRAARPALAGKPEEFIRDRVAEIVSARRSVPLVPGKGKAKGRMVFERSAAHFESAKADLRRIVEDILGTSSNDAKPSKPSEPTKVRLSEAEKAAAKALLEACKGDLARVKAAIKAVSV